MASSQGLSSFLVQPTEAENVARVFLETTMPEDTPMPLATALERVASAAHLGSDDNHIRFLRLVETCQLGTIRLTMSADAQVTFFHPGSTTPTHFMLSMHVNTGLSFKSSEGFLQYIFLCIPCVERQQSLSMNLLIEDNTKEKYG